MPTKIEIEFSENATTIRFDGHPIEFDVRLSYQQLSRYFASRAEFQRQCESHAEAVALGG